VIVDLWCSNAGKFVNGGVGIVDVDVRVVRWAQAATGATNRVNRRGPASTTTNSIRHYLVMTVSNTHDGSHCVGNGDGLFVPFRRQSTNAAISGGSGDAAGTPSSGRLFMAVAV
jgi:hypothetical protein